MNIILNECNETLKLFSQPVVKQWKNNGQQYYYTNTKENIFFSYVSVTYSQRLKIKCLCIDVLQITQRFRTVTMVWQNPGGQCSPWPIISKKGGCRFYLYFSSSWEATPPSLIRSNRYGGVVFNILICSMIKV